MQDHYPIGVAANPDPPTANPDPPTWTPTLRRRVLLGMIAALCVLLLVVVPPYVSISRYQRGVAAAMSGALGRPVRFDSISLTLLPVPGLTIHNFVVAESPEFGYEPVLRADTVEARLRFASLWRRRLEVSRISLDGPSINLVRRPGDGRWNLQGILMQASQLRSAPTAQQRAGDAPRFPYVEATDARINVKNGDSKLPFSVKEAEFALWLPEPDQWRLRMVGKPVRTDTDVNDVGLLRVEGTLGRAADLGTAPIALEAGWKPTPLGEAGKLTAGADQGWRGDVSATAALRGTLAAGRLSTDVHLRGLHRADLLPARTVDVDAHCEAATAGLLRSLHDVRCAVPTDDSLSLAGMLDALRRLPAGDSALAAESARAGVLLLRGDVPNLLDWRTASGSATLSGAAASDGLAWARLFTRSVPTATTLGGTLSLTASLEPAGDPQPRWSGTLLCRCILPQPPHATGVNSPAAGGTQVSNRWLVQASRDDRQTAADEPFAFHVTAAPVPPNAPHTDETLEDQGVLPANATPAVEGAVTRTGYTLHYHSPGAVAQAAAVVPRLGEGQPETKQAALDVRSGWYTPQEWVGPAPQQRTSPVRRQRRRPH